jgi:hypothetical protein
MIINLKEIKYFFLTIPSNQKRIKNIKAAFKTQGIRLNRVDSVIGQNISKLQSGALGFIQMIDRGLNDNSLVDFKPFCILEDDTNIYRKFPDYINIPENADLLYIGTSTYGYNHSIKWANQNVFIESVDNRTDLYRILNMLSTHGIIITSLKGANYIKYAMRLAIKHNIAYDNYFAGMQSNYNIYCLKEPLVYQDGIVGGQEEPTRQNLSLKLLNVIIPEHYKYKD